MKLQRSLILAVAAVALVTTGCAPHAREDPMNASLTWQEAKETTQEKERDIAAVVPDDMVIDITQAENGILLSCDEDRHTWNGLTTVTLAAESAVDTALTAIRDHYAESAFVVREDHDIDGDLRIQLLSTDTSETYLVSHGIEADQITIDSGSACFTLPDGVYPGGEF